MPDALATPDALAMPDALATPDALAMPDERGCVRGRERVGCAGCPRR
jgi:hypothetical protein